MRSGPDSVGAVLFIKRAENSFLWILIVAL